MRPVCPSLTGRWASLLGRLGSGGIAPTRSSEQFTTPPRSSAQPKLNGRPNEHSRPRSTGVAAGVAVPTGPVQWATPRPPHTSPTCRSKRHRQTLPTPRDGTVVNKARRQHEPNRQHKTREQQVSLKQAVQKQLPKRPPRLLDRIYQKLDPADQQTLV